ncbi:MAG: type II toxin-antitoxin system RelE/ParE family toxin [Nanoarchaeota archaeon]|nr:type II toxin-antitoxin system RelE/ParE family toxin [Nanoarchaeota archaeon]
MYKINFSDSALKFLNKLPKEKQKHIFAVLQRVKIRPEAHFQRLIGEKTYKLRVGKYSIIADIRKKDLFILIIEIGHRKNIYK